jgi:hypothetical protein
LCPFIENGEASLNSIPDIDEGFLYGLTLGVATGKGRATDNKTAIFGVFFEDDFQIHLIINERGRYNRFRMGETGRSVYEGAW